MLGLYYVCHDFGQYSQYFMLLLFFQPNRLVERMDSKVMMGGIPVDSHLLTIFILASGLLLLLMLTVIKLQMDAKEWGIYEICILGEATCRYIYKIVGYFAFCLSAYLVCGWSSNASDP